MHLKLVVPKWARSPWTWLGLLLLITLYFPATREAHVLTARLLFHLNGKTIVQGQPSGCTIYTVPNVKFSEAYTAELRARSGRSLDDYALALGDLRYQGLDVPPMNAAWTNHPLVNWAAFQLTRNAILSARDAMDTNGVVTNLTVIHSQAELARKAIEVARAASPTNGAWWLLEAGLNFVEEQPEAALVALREAAKFPVWDAHMKQMKRHLVEIFHQAGLSRLDSIIAAGGLTPDYAVLFTQDEIRRSLGRQFKIAVEESKDTEFAQLFSLLVKLRQCHWGLGGPILANGLRIYDPDNALANAMARRLDLPLVPEFDPLLLDYDPKIHDERKRISQETTDEFLSRYAIPGDVAMHKAQDQGGTVERQLRRELREMAWQSGRWWWFYSGVVGVISLLTLAGLSVLLITELPFVWLKRRTEHVRRVPRNRGFWLLVVGSLIPSILLVASALYSCGAFSRGGFGPPEPPPTLPPVVEASLIGILIWSGCLLIGLVVWLDGPSRRPAWKILHAAAVIYVALIVVMALTRSVLAERALSPWW